MASTSCSFAIFLVLVAGCAPIEGPPEGCPGDGCPELGGYEGGTAMLAREPSVESFQLNDGSLVWLNAEEGAVRRVDLDTNEVATLASDFVPAERPELKVAAGRAFRDLFEVDFADTDLFTDDPATLGSEFAEVEDHPLPVADRVKAWCEAGPDDTEPFRSMRRRRLDALRAAIAAPGSVLANWRLTRRFPAWM